MKIILSSEIGTLNGVIVHIPESEVENITPQIAERALYSDILTLRIVRSEGFCHIVSDRYPDW